MATIDLCRDCGRSPTRARTSSQAVRLVWPKHSMPTPLGTPWRCARHSLDPRRCVRNGHYRSLSHSRAVANPWAHVVAAWWSSRAQASNEHAIGDTMAVCMTFIGPARKHWGWPPSISSAIAGGRQPVGPRRCGLVDAMVSVGQVLNWSGVDEGRSQLLSTEKTPLTGSSGKWGTCYFSVLAPGPTIFKLPPKASSTG